MKVEDAKTRGASWFGGSVVSNPIADTVLADTGPISVSPIFPQFKFEFDIVITISSSVSNVRISVEHRNDTNTGNVASVTFIVPSGISVVSLPVRLQQNERVRIVTAQSIAGDVSASIHILRLYD